MIENHIVCIPFRSLLTLEEYQMHLKTNVLNQIKKIFNLQKEHTL